jgi:hypothetical protein
MSGWGRPVTTAEGRPAHELRLGRRTFIPSSPGLRRSHCRIPRDLGGAGYRTNNSI